MVSAAVLIDAGFGKYLPDYTSVDLLLRTLETGESGVQAIIGATTLEDQEFKPETIRALQKTLIEKQFFSGKADGTFNLLFVQAMENYARSAASQQGN